MGSRWKMKKEKWEKPHLGQAEVHTGAPDSPSTYQKPKAFQKPLQQQQLPVESDARGAQAQGSGFHAQEAKHFLGYRMSCSHTAVAKSCHPPEAEATKSLVTENAIQKNVCVSKPGSRIIPIWVGLIDARLHPEGPSTAGVNE